LVTKHSKNRFNGKKCVFLRKKIGRERVNQFEHLPGVINYFMKKARTENSVVIIFVKPWFSLLQNGD